MKRTHGIGLPLILGMAGRASSAAQSAGASPVLEALRLEAGETVRLDGVLDVEFWARAAAVMEFS